MSGPAGSAGDGSLRNGAQLFPVDPAEEEKRHDDADQFGHWERPPHQLQPVGQGQEVGYRQQDQQLSGQGDDGSVQADPQRLKYRAEDDAEAGNGEAPADDPKR